jgi:transposase
MRSVRNVLRMNFVDQRKTRNIADMTGIPYSTVYDNITIAKAKGLTWPQIEAMSDEALEQALSSSNTQRPLPDWAYVEKELKRAGVTLQLLWQEHKEAHPDSYQYSRFCELYAAWAKKSDVYTPIPHKGGEELFVDYSGDKIPYICLETSAPLEAEIFVAVLGASNRIYVEASRSQQLPFWVESNINAFEYNGGVTEMVIPDNLLSAITTPDRYEATANRTYQDLGEHYGTFIVPARSRKPKDKAKVEQGVLSTQQEILAPLRNHTFFGLHAINEAIQPRLDQLNNRPFQKRLGSRESQYLEIEKPALKPLPATRYSYRDWVVKLMVGQDHHVYIHEHSYSVPFQYARAETEAAISINMVEILHKGQVIARHWRSFVKGGRTTVREHMPIKYQYYFDSYDQEKLLNKAKDVGPHMVKWAEVVFNLKGRPPKTLCHSVLGALSLVKAFGNDRLEAICERALILNIHSYKALQSMLNNGADHLPLPVPGTTTSHLPQQHANVRGAEQFA